jgi:hypothetical protein
MPEEQSPGSEAVQEAHRRLLQLLRGLSELDAALGPWRPDYGGMAARAAREPGREVDVAAAHHGYASALRYFADHPEAAWSLGEPARVDVSAAIADSRLRFGAPVIPLEALIPPGSDSPPRAAAGWAPEEGLPAAALAGEPGAPERPPRNPLALVIGLVSLVVTVLIVAVVVVAAKTFLGPGPTAEPALAGPPTPTPATAAGGPLPDVLAPARSCPALPSGRLPASLAPSGASSGIAIDPHTGYSTPYVSVTLAQPADGTSPPFSLVIPVLQFGASPPDAGGPLDRAGTVQLIAYWDGAHGGQWYAAIRSWSGTSWSAPSDSANPGVDVSENGSTVTLSWMGLTPGDRYGAVVAAQGTCAVLDLNGSLSPTRAYGS